MKLIITFLDSKNVAHIGYLSSENAIYEYELRGENIEAQ